MEPFKKLVGLITGANVGIGKEVAKQLALSNRYRKIYLACRNKTKADLAKQDLENITGMKIFEVVLMDTCSSDSVKKALASLDENIDDLVMNAGGSGGKTPFALTKDGVTEIFASNVLGHVLFLEGLLKTNKLKRTAVFAGSEAARGVPKLGMKRPSLATYSVEELSSLCDGSYFKQRKPNATLAYGQVKLIGALWMASLARQNPSLRFITISPGNTRGTESSRDLPAPVRLLIKFILMPVVMPLLKLVHNVDQGAQRLVDGLNNENLKSGSFYASEANSLVGPLVDQSKIFSDLSSHTYQDHAFEAVHRFIGERATN